MTRQAMAALMVTGHREIKHPDVVSRLLHQLLTGVGWSAAVSGGAAGADTIFAEVAIDADVPLHVILPNRYYRQAYRDSIPQRLVDAATSVHCTVERPICHDWRHRWKAERWWLDNHKRNHQMVGTSTDACVVSPRHPLNLLDEPNGGTVECVRYLQRSDDHRGVWWVADWPDTSDVRWVDFR